MYIHTGVESYPFPCEVCPKRFISKYKFKVHMMRHNKIKNFQCTLCGLRTTTRKELKVHTAYHSKDIPFPCKMCTRVFTSHGKREHYNLRSFAYSYEWFQVAVTRHIRVVHRGHKPYVCTYCQLAFSKAETLKHHTMRHTGEKPHACQQCDRRFIQQVALKAHMKTHNKVRNEIIEFKAESTFDNHLE